MFCCPNCFADTFLKNHISAISEKNGECSFCAHRAVALLDPADLADRFEPLFNLYEKDSNGNSLIEIIQEDWNVLAAFRKPAQKRLLTRLARDNDLLKSKYKPVFLHDKTNIEQWEKFRLELKHKNRFFPNDAPERTHLEPFSKHIGLIHPKESTKFYRARINSGDKPYPLSKMGRPPKKYVTNGRANPIGIPYLYVASTIQTAIAEIRGHKGETVTVAEFTQKRKLELADLRDPKNNISPFELNDENELELIYKNMPYLTHLGNELSKPVIPREAHLEYLPSQYLCEMLKHIGFHGIVYNSSVSTGINYVLFNDKQLKSSTTYQYRIVGTTVTAEEIT